MDEQNDGDELCNHRTEFEESYFKAVATANKKIQYEQNSIRTSSQKENYKKKNAVKRKLKKPRRL